RAHALLGLGHAGRPHGRNIGRTLQAADDFARGGRAVFQYHRYGRIVDVERQAVAEQEDQGDGQKQAHGQIAFVAQQLPHFLAQQGGEPAREPGCLHAPASAGAGRARARPCSTMAMKALSMSMPLSPASSRTSRGVPSASMRPASWMAMRSQYSASSMKWVVMMMVTPVCASAVMVRQKARRARGSMPLVGS